MQPQIHALIVSDPQRHHTHRVHQHADRLQLNRPSMTEARRKALLDAEIAAGRVPVPVQDELYAVAEEACPDGHPNCRNCGDPAFAATCLAAGHCPHCGTRHGIAPASHLDRIGLALHPLDAMPPDGHQWDPAQKVFRRP